MEVIEKVLSTDRQKIKKIDRKKLERLAGIIAEFHADIEELDAGLLHKLFESSIISDDFNRLDKERKKKIFSCYSNLKYVMGHFHNFCYENALGEFNN